LDRKKLIKAKSLNFLHPKKRLQMFIKSHFLSEMGFFISLFNQSNNRSTLKIFEQRKR